MIGAGGGGAFQDGSATTYHAGSGAVVTATATWPSSADYLEVEDSSHVFVAELVIAGGGGGGGYAAGGGGGGVDLFISDSEYAGGASPTAPTTTRSQASPAP